jgi:tetratricopeptide (TPR) repeat protein
VVSLRKTLRLVAAILLCAVLLCPQAFVRAQSNTAQGVDPYAGRLREFEEFVRALMEHDRIPGMTIGFFKDDYTWVKGFGYADPENRTPALKQIAGDYERPVVYFRRAFAANPSGVMRAKTFQDIGGRWLKRTEMAGAGAEFLGAAVELYPKDAALREMLGDFLLLKGLKAEAEESYRKAFNLDPNPGKGSTVDEYVTRKLSSGNVKTN